MKAEGEPDYTKQSREEIAAWLHGSAYLIGGLTRRYKSRGISDDDEGKVSRVTLDDLETKDRTLLVEIRVTEAEDDGS